MFPIYKPFALFPRKCEKVSADMNVCYGIINFEFITKLVKGSILKVKCIDSALDVIAGKESSLEIHHLPQTEINLVTTPLHSKQCLKGSNIQSLVSLLKYLDSNKRAKSFASLSTYISL